MGCQRRQLWHMSNAVWCMLSRLQTSWRWLPSGSVAACCSCLLLWHYQNVSNSNKLNTVPLLSMYFILITEMLPKQRCILKWNLYAICLCYSKQKFTATSLCWSQFSWFWLVLLSPAHIHIWKLVKKMLYESRLSRYKMHTFFNVSVSVWCFICFQLTCIITYLQNALLSVI